MSGAEVAQQLVEKMLPANAYDGLIDWITRSSMPGILRTIRAKGGPQPNEAHQHKMMVVLRRAAMAVMPRDVWLRETATIYSNHFTENELGVMLRFYNSETGEKYVRLTPTLLSEATAMGRRPSAAMDTPEFRDRLTEDLRQEFSR